MAIALYPGAFKPPHRGHFGVVQSLLNNTHKGLSYTADDYLEIGRSVLTGKQDQTSTITEVIVIIGGGVRNGISAEESKNVWEIYKKYLKGKVTIVISDLNPMMTSKNIAQSNPSQEYYAITGVRSEDDLTDLKRITAYKNTPNVKGLAIPGDESQTRATDFRKAILSGNLDQIIDFFPKQLKREEILSIINMLKQSIISEMMLESLDTTLLNMFGSDFTPSSQPTTNQEPTTSVEKPVEDKMVSTFEQLTNILGPEFDMDLTNNVITIKLPQEEETSTGFDYVPYMASLLSYMIDKGMNITPIPEVKIKQDIEESSNFFGRTAYYDPGMKEIVLYTHNRHPKDVMRSFAHEMIHHKQNMEGRLANIQTSNTNEDGHLLELEKEAYLQGNIVFRNWEDKVKNQK
jgi:hypothetical protein